MLYFSVSLLNRLNKTESGMFLPCMIPLLLKGLLFRSILLGRGYKFETILDQFRKKLLDMFVNCRIMQSVKHILSFRFRNLSPNVSN